MSLRERLNQAPSFTAETVEAWGEKIEVRSMTVAEKARIIKIAGDDLAPDVLLPNVVIATCFDPEDGSKVFSSTDMDWLLGQSAGAVETLATAGLRVSGIGDEAFNAGKDVS